MHLSIFCRDQHTTINRIWPLMIHKEIQKRKICYANKRQISYAPKAWSDPCAVQYPCISEYMWLLLRSSALIDKWIKRSRCIRDKFVSRIRIINRLHWNSTELRGTLVWNNVLTNQDLYTIIHSQVGEVSSDMQLKLQWHIIKILCYTVLLTKLDAYSTSSIMLWATDTRGLSNTQLSRTHQVLKFRRLCRQTLLGPGEDRAIKISFTTARDDHYYMKEKCDNTITYLFDMITFPSSPNNHLHLEHIALADTWGD